MKLPQPCPMGGLPDGLEEDDRDLPRSFNGHSGDPGETLAHGCFGIFWTFIFIMAFCAIVGPYLP